MVKHSSYFYLLLSSNKTGTIKHSAMQYVKVPYDTFGGKKRQRCTGLSAKMSACTVAKVIYYALRIS